MTQDECQKLFSDFSRIKNEKTRHILGSGLGLSTLKKLATIYNGDISRNKPARCRKHFFCIAAQKCAVSFILVE